MRSDDLHRLPAAGHDDSLDRAGVLALALVGIPFLLGCLMIVAGVLYGIFWLGVHLLRWGLVHL